MAKKTLYLHVWKSTESLNRPTHPTPVTNESKLMRYMIYYNRGLLTLKFHFSPILSHLH